MIAHAVPANSSEPNKKPVVLPLRPRVEPPFSQEDRYNLELFASYIRATGNYEFSPIVELAYSVHEVSNDKTGSLLLPQKIQQLCHQAEQAVTQIEQNSIQLREALDYLGQIISYKNPSLSDLSPIAEITNRHILALSTAIHTLSHLADKHGLVDDGFMHRFYAFRSDAEHEKTKAILRYHKEGLRYILSFLQEHVHPDAIAIECEQGVEWLRYTSRMLGYCNALPRNAQLLSDTIQDLIKEKAPTAYLTAEEDDDEDL